MSTAGARSAQDAVRDQLVAGVAAERPRRRRPVRARVAAPVAGTPLGATAVAQATRLLAAGEPIESLMPPGETQEGLAGHVLGTAPDLERDGRLDPYGRPVAGSCENFDRLPAGMSDALDLSALERVG